MYRIVERESYELTPVVTEAAMSPVIPYIEEPDNDRSARPLRAAGAEGRSANINVFKVMAHSPQVMRDWLRMATPLLRDGLMLEPRLREIAILRVARTRAVSTSSGSTSLSRAPAV